MVKFIKTNLIKRLKKEKETHNVEVSFISRLRWMSFQRGVVSGFVLPSTTVQVVRHQVDLVQIPDIQQKFYFTRVFFFVLGKGREIKTFTATERQADLWLRNILRNIHTVK